MKTSDIKQITLLCETKDGRFIAGDTTDRELICHITDKVSFVEIEPNFVKKIDADKIAKKKRKLF